MKISLKTNIFLVDIIFFNFYRRSTTILLLVEVEAKMSQTLSLIGEIRAIKIIPTEFIVK